MARMARVVVPGYPHHVTQRGNRRQTTFFNDRDYQHYIELVAQFAHEFDTQVCAYRLVPNHVHLVMVPAQVDGLRAPLGEAHRRYTRMVNFRHGWRGHLWQERFRSFVMDENYLLATVRYVERNPVVAHLCGSPGGWDWSSAAARLRAEDDALVQVTPMLDRVDDWASYLSDHTGDDEKRRLIAKHSRTGRPLGDGRFVRALEQITGRKLAPRPPGRRGAAPEQDAFSPDP